MPSDSENLKEMLLSLLRSGLTQLQISDRAGIPQPTISRFLNGRQQDLSYTQGKAVERLHKTASKKL